MSGRARNSSRRPGTDHSQSQSEFLQSPATSQPVNLDQQVRALLNFIICHSTNKVPIKVTDLMSLADGKNEVLRRMPLVTKLLEERYGIKLILLDGTPKRYICLAEAPTASMHELTAAQRPQLTLLYIILTYIFLRGNRVEEEKLYSMLDTLGVNVHEEHVYFGDKILKLIEDTFVKQQYLKRDRSQLNPYDDPKNSYSWGLRAKSELSYKEVVKFASKLFDQDESFFQEQLAMAEANDNPEISQSTAES